MEEEDAVEDTKKSKKGKRASKASEENGTDKKKGKKDTSDDENEENDEEEEEYEVEKVVGDKMVKGVRHFLIRWKGHDEDSDTWEPESTLNCDELINVYLSNKPTSSKSPKKGKPSKEIKKKKMPQNDDEENSSEETYEVDRIIEVHFKKNGHREFLVHWKGYSATENTWEPEENMNCPDLVDKFMAKVEKAKAMESKELRVRRKPTDRFTVLMAQSGRKLSKRNSGKQRVHYFDAE